MSSSDDRKVFKNKVPEATDILQITY